MMIDASIGQVYLLVADQWCRITDLSFTAVASRMEFVSDTDPETTHWENDQTMFQVLRELGYSEAVQIAQDRTRWYA